MSSAYRGLVEELEERMKAGGHATRFECELLCAEIQRLWARERELVAANNAELERRRTAEAQSVETLLAAVRAAGERLQADPLSIELFGDGSGSVMAPEFAPDGELCGAVSVAQFDAPDGLMDWLREGSLDQDEKEEAGEAFVGGLAVGVETVPRG